jgi:glycosyltransferase involved in cell wall biosynthesis
MSTFLLIEASSSILRSHLSKVSMGINLSVAIITYNEEINLKRCLQSINSIASEIIVIDSGSVDSTVDIARSFNAKVIERPFQGHIQQKNIAIEQCQYDMILSLDADEALSKELLNSIKNVLDTNPMDAYQMNRKTNYRGRWIKHCGWYPDSSIRLFKKSKAHWGGENPHDKVIPDPDVKPGKLKGDILHYSYHDLKSHLDQITFFTGIMAREMIIKGKKPSLFKELFGPPFKFFQSYFLQLGFLDGYHGFQVCKISAFATYMKYARLREYYVNPDLK